jgi:hypothetical protein
MNETTQPTKPPIRYHGRVLLFALLVVVLPATLIAYVSDPHLTLWTFAPGVIAAVAILGYMYAKWWREGRLR